MFSSDQSKTKSSRVRDAYSRFEEGHEADSLTSVFLDRSTNTIRPSVIVSGIVGNTANDYGLDKSAY